MAFTNSPLVEFTRISPNRTSPRKHSIDTLTIHCLPVDETELLTKEGWVSLRNIKVGDIIATSDLYCNIIFDSVKSVVPIRKEDVYSFSTGLMATKKHRLMVKGQYELDRPTYYRMREVEDIARLKCSMYIPICGKYKGKGLPISLDEMNFLCAVQADASYTMSSDNKRLTRIDIKVFKQRKIDELRYLLNALHFNYNEYEVVRHDMNPKHNNFGKRFSIKDQRAFDLCYEYLDRKKFKFDWIEMTDAQALYFMEFLSHWDGTRIQRDSGYTEFRYSSAKQQNIDVVMAVMALHGIGSRLDSGISLCFKNKPYKTLGTVDMLKIIPNMEVSCVEVESGAILIRQNNRTSIVGNCMAGNISIETCGAIFADRERKASSNYGIDSKGRIALYCPESDRSWCTSNAAHDDRAITIEVANLTNKEPYPCSEAAMKSLILLCADICKRNNIKKLLWKADKSLIGQVDKQNLDVHRWYAKKSCLPVDTTELLTENGWKYLTTLSIGERVASVNRNTLGIEFTPIIDIVEIRKEEVIKVFGVEVTRDHNMLYCNGHKEFRNTEAKNLLVKDNFSIPSAGYFNASGIDISDKELELIILILTNGRKILNESTFEGISFNIPKYPNRVLSILKDCIYIDDYEMKDGRIDVFDSHLMRFYSKYIEGDNLWKLMNLNKMQVTYLFTSLLQHSGKLSQKVKDLMFAIATLNGAGITKSENGESFLSEPILRKGESSDIRRLTDVSCVTVDSGYILIRQNGSSFVVGNCPGNYLYEKHFYIADEVNKLLGTYDGKNDITVTSSIPKNVPIAKSTNDSNDKIIWDFLKAKGLNDFAVAGVIGNLFAESGLSPINLQNNFEKKLGYNNKGYTKAVDDGTYINFIKDAAGYGLAQWTYWTRKKALLEFAKANKASIGDLRMQLNFLWQEFNNNGRLLTLLRSATSVRMASDFMLKIFERPADMSEAVQEKRASYGMKYYNKFAKAEVKEVTPPVVETPKVEEKKEEIVSTTPIVSEDIKVTIPAEKKITKSKSSNKIAEFFVKLLIEFFKALFNRKPSTKKSTPVDFVLNKKPEENSYAKPKYTPKDPVFERPADMLPAPLPPIKETPKEPVAEPTPLPVVNAFEEYKVKIIKAVNYRSGPGTKYKILGLLNANEVYTISAEEMNGPTKWGKLKSGAGWVSLSFTKRI